MNCSFDVCRSLLIACKDACMHNCACLQSCTSNPDYLTKYCATPNTYWAGVTVLAIMGSLAVVFLIILFIGYIRNKLRARARAPSPPPYSVGSLPRYEDILPPAYV